MYSETINFAISQKIRYLIFILTCIVVFCVSLYPFESVVFLSFLLPFALLLINKKLGIFFLILSLPILQKLMYFIANGGASYIFFGSFILGIGLVIYDNVIRGIKCRSYLTKFDILIILFTIYCFISLLISGGSSYGYAKYFVFLTSIFTIYLLVNYIKSDEDISLIFSTIYLFGIILLIYAILKISNLQPFFNASFRGRFTILDINPIWIARYFSFTLFIGIFKIKNLSADWISNLGKIILLVLISLSQFYFILITASRGPLFAIIIALIISYGINKKIMFKHIVFFLVFIICVILFMYFLTPVNFIDRILSKNTASKNTTLIRIFANYEAIRLFLKNPILGVGFGNFIFGGGFFITLIYPHNIFTEIMSETGLIGLILFLTVIIDTIYYLKKIKSKFDKDRYRQIVGLFVAAFINANLSGHIGANVYLFISIGLIYASYLFTIKNKIT